MGCVVEKVTLGQTFLQELHFSIPLTSHTHSLLYRQSNMNIATDSIVRQGIYIVIMPIEDKYFGVITNPVIQFSGLLRCQDRLAVPGISKESSAVLQTSRCSGYMFTKHTIGILRYTTVKHPHLANQMLPQTNSVYTMTASC